MRRFQLNSWPRCPFSPTFATRSRSPRAARHILRCGAAAASHQLPLPLLHSGGMGAGLLLFSSWDTSGFVLPPCNTCSTAGRLPPSCLCPARGRCMRPALPTHPHLTIHPLPAPRPTPNTTTPTRLRCTTLLGRVPFMPRMSMPSPFPHTTADGSLPVLSPPPDLEPLPDRHRAGGPTFAVLLAPLLPPPLYNALPLLSPLSPRREASHECIH